MRYRQLGKTGELVSQIGFGASPLGNVFGDVSSQDVYATVGSAIDQGINIFDVSPYYGLTVAESRLGEALESRRDEVILATKCGRYGSDLFDFSADTVIREFENSLRRLRTDRIDVLQVHDLEFGDIQQVIHETIPAMRVLQQQGKVGFVGITGYWPGLLQKVADECPVDTILNYCHSNLLIDDMNDTLTPFAKTHGVALMNASPLHMGLLSGLPVPEWHPAPDALRAVAHQVIALCRQWNVKPGTLALWHCLQHPVACTTFVGMRNVEQLEANVEALTLNSDPALLAAIAAIVEPVRNTVWPSGRPENWDAQASLT